MKVLLINPPTEYIIRESLPPIVEDSTGIYPPLGLLYVAAYAEAVEGCEVKVIDCPAEKQGHETLAARIAAFAGAFSGSNHDLHTDRCVAGRPGREGNCSRTSS